MFGNSRKSKDGGDDRLEQWERSPRVEVTRATGLKTRLLLENIGRELEAKYRNEPCVLRPLAVFRKPAYNRMYVEAECDGEVKIFNISDLLLRRPDSDSYYDDDESTPKRSSLSLVSVLVFLLCGGSAAALFFDLIPAQFNPLLPPAANVPPGEAVVPDDNNAAPREDAQANPSPPAAAPQEAPATVAEQPEPSPAAPVISGNPSPAASAEDANFGREFSDASGSFRTRAEFVEFQPDRGRGSRVILRKADGSEVDVAMNSLSKEDQAWIRAEVKRRKLQP